MKTLSLIVMLLVPSGGERERGLEHYRAGRYQEAQLEFQAAVDAAPESAELQWNLALAAWRAGDLQTAELAAEQYAALDKQAKVELYRGLLGAVRYDEAEQLEQQADAASAAPQAAPGAGAETPQPLALIERALQKAQQAKQHFVAAARAKPTPEGLRNVERAARKVEELQKRRDELSQQQEPQDGEKKPQQDEQQKDDEKKDDQQQDDQQKDSKGDDQQKQDQQQKGEQEGEQQQQGESGEQQPEQPQNQEGESPEPRPGEQEQQPAEPKPQESAPDQQQPSPQGVGDQQEQTDQPPRGDAPGEQVGESELTPEQQQRVLEHLRDLERQLQELRNRLKRGRRPVERDW